MSDETISDASAGRGHPPGVGVSSSGDPSSASGFGQTIADARPAGPSEIAGGSSGPGSASRPPHAQPTAGTLQIVRRIGGGGMGAIFLARDNRTHRWVAVKRLNEQFAGDERLHARFLTEARSIAALSHFHIVALYAMDEDAQGPYLVMEYVAGPTRASGGEHPSGSDDQPNPPLDLDASVKQNGPLDVNATVALGMKLCSALSYAHKHGVIHRDVKPANILITEEGEPKLTDFGLARQGDAQWEKMTLAGAQLLSLGYGAPEQEVDSSRVDHRADLYGLGATLWYALTGQSPRFYRESEVPAALRPVLDRAMQKDREKRFQSAEDLHEALSETFHNRSSAPAVTTDAGPFKPGKCVGCGHQNPENARFCQGCGAGLFEPCPKCHAENHVGTKHCASCGVKVADFKSATEAVRQARQLLKEHKTQQAINVSRGALATGLLQDELQAVLQQAQAIEPKFQALQAKARQFVQQGAFEQAIQVLDEALALDPQREPLPQLRKECLQRISHRDAQATSQKIEALRRQGRQALEQKRFDPAIQACTALGELKPGHPDIAAILPRANALKRDHQARVEQVKQLRMEYRYAEAFDVLRTMEADYPWDDRLENARVDFESALKRLDSLLKTARDDAAQNRYYAVLEGCVSILQLKPDLPEAAALQEQAKAVSQDHVSRLDEAAGFKESYAFAEAADALRQIVADYPWDTAAAAQWRECEEAAAELERLITKARAAKLPTALSAWRNVLELNPNHLEARERVAKLVRELASRGRKRIVAAVMAGLSLTAAAVVGIIAAVDHAHLTAAQQQLHDHNYDSARSELAGLTAFWRTRAASLSKEIDSAQRADLIVQATADADGGKLDDSAKEFDAAAQLAKSAHLAGDSEHSFIAHLFRLAEGSTSLETSREEYDLAVKTGGGVGYTDLPAAQARFLKSLLDRATVQEKAGDIAGAVATVKMAAELPNDPSSQAALSTRLRELTALAKVKDVAEAQRHLARATEDEGNKKSVPSIEASGWQEARAFDAAAGKAYEAGDYQSAQEAWRHAADGYAAASSQAIAASNLWQEMQNLHRTPGDPAMAIFWFMDFQKRYPGQHADDLQKYVDDELDQLWWGPIRQQFEKVDRLRSEIGKKQDEIFDETDKEMKKREQDELATLVAELKQAKETIWNMGYTDDGPPPTGGTELAALRQKRDNAKYTEWKRVTLNAILNNNGKLNEEADLHNNEPADEALHVGLAYYTGTDGKPRDYEKAMTYFRKAANAGDATAMNNVGVMYENGNGVDQDYQQAMAWYRKAAGAGSAVAMNSIGMLYANGLGVDQDNRQAIIWYRKAAELGDKNAIKHLAKMGSQ